MPILGSIATSPASSARRLSSHTCQLLAPPGSGRPGAGSPPPGPTPRPSAPLTLPPSAPLEPPTPAVPGRRSREESQTPERFPARRPLKVGTERASGAPRSPLPGGHGGRPASVFRSKGRGFFASWWGCAGRSTVWHPWLSRCIGGKVPALERGLRVAGGITGKWGAPRLGREKNELPGSRVHKSRAHPACPALLSLPGNPRGSLVLSPQVSSPTCGHNYLFFRQKCACVNVRA